MMPSPSTLLEGLEQLRGWLSTSLLGLIAWVVIKGMAMMLKSQIENRRLTAVERQQEREGYGPVLASLNAELARINLAHAGCEERMTRLEGELSGYHKQILMQSAHMLTQIPANETASDMVQEAARRVQQIIGDR
jgi:hypothetical protein